MTPGRRTLALRHSCSNTCVMLLFVSKGGSTPGMKTKQSFLGHGIADIVIPPASEHVSYVCPS